MWKKKQSTIIHALQLIKQKEEIPNLDDLLKFSEDLSLESGSDISELTDIFNEFHKESFLRPYVEPNVKYLSKYEADRRTSEKFTDDFKKTIRTVREELGVKDSLFDEELLIEGALKSNKTIVHVDVNIRESPISIDKNEEDQETATSLESNVWQMLSANSDANFKVSSPVFDAFRQEEKHWLERPPISWKKVDNSRLKCEAWLKEVDLSVHEE